MLKDAECMLQCDISYANFYKFKKEIAKSLTGESDQKADQADMAIEDDDDITRSSGLKS